MASVARPAAAAAATIARRPAIPSSAQGEQADRHRHRGGEQHVHGRGPGVGEGQERRPGHEPGVQARGRAVEAGAEEGGRPHEEEGGQHRGHARRGLRLAEHRERAPGQPVEERRLLEPGLALQRRPHPLAGPVHLDRHARVAGLVGAEEGNGPEAEGEEGQDEGEQDRRRAGRQAVRIRPILMRGLPRVPVSHARRSAAAARPMAVAGRATIAPSRRAGNRELAAPGGRDRGGPAGGPHPEGTLRERRRGRVQGRDRPRHRGRPRLRARDPRDHPLALPDPRHRHRGDRPRAHGLPPRLVRRPPRRDGELRALLPVLLRLGGARDRRRDRRGGRLRPLAGRAVLGGEGRRRAPQRAAAQGDDREPPDREPRHHGVPVRPAREARRAAAARSTG